ncbi:MAG: lactonase family protein [Gemmataceae bacterium]
MKFGFCSLALMLLASPLFAAEPGKYLVYFGCYTGTKPGDSKGISVSTFDANTGTLSKPVTVFETVNPSFLAVHPKLKVLYAVGEVGDENKPAQGVSAYGMDTNSGGLKKINYLPSGGSAPCHVSLSPDGKIAVCANYSGGSCAFYQVDANGKLEKELAFFKHAGKGGPDKGRQEMAHGHCGRFDPSGKFCYVCDLGLDCVKVYSIGATITPAGEITLPPGSGPRHITIAPQGNLAFVNGELNSTVNVVKLNAEKGTGEVVQSISTLPGGKPVAGNSTAEVLLHPNGKLVYCSNRGHNSIAAFSWDGSKLTPIGHATKGINIPRNFNLDPTNKWMLVANQDGNDVAVFKLDEQGVPQPTGVTVPVGKPVCVKFVEKDSTTKGVAD